MLSIKEDDQAPELDEEWLSEDELKQRQEKMTRTV
jgi:hypothetical protein